MGELVRGLEVKLKNSKSKILSGKWIWPFQLDPFLWVRGTGPAHSAPACAPFSHSLFPTLLVLLFLEPVCTLSMSILLHLILRISWTFACQSRAGKFHLLKTQKGGTRMHLSSQISKAKSLPSYYLSIKCGVFVEQVEICSPETGNEATSQS